VPAPKINHTSFLKMTHRAAPDERFANLVHFDGAQYARKHANFFQCVLQRQSVDDRREHAHVIASGAFNLESLLPAAAKNISAPTTIAISTPSSRTSFSLARWTAAFRHVRPNPATLQRFT